jgi:hypothetical protein
MVARLSMICKENPGPETFILPPLSVQATVSIKKIPVVSRSQEAEDEHPHSAAERVAEVQAVRVLPPAPPNGPPFAVVDEAAPLLCGSASIEKEGRCFPAVIYEMKCFLCGLANMSQPFRPPSFSLVQVISASSSLSDRHFPSAP